MDSKKYINIVMDFQNLMSCIKCHEDSTNIPIILETLKTIIDICSNEDCGKDAFREEGGLEFLFELVSSTDSTTLLEHLLKTLAFVIDENVHSQMYVTKKEYFLILQAIIQRPSFPSVILKNSLLLTSSILFQNSLAQSLMSEIGFLQDIIKLFKHAASLYMCNNINSSVLSDSPVDILISANSALCFAVNNPQNERNQEACSVLFPLSLKLFESSFDTALSGPLSSFLSLCVASNVKSQEKFAEVDGLLVIKRSLQKHYDSITLDVCSVVSKCIIQSITNLIGVITAVASENEKNAASLGKLGVLSLIIKLLIAGILDEKLKTRLILALTYCIDASSNCKSYVLQFDNFHSFLKGCFQTSDPELVAASKYLLQVFLNGNDDFSENDSLQQEQLFPSVSDKGSVFKLKTENISAKRSVANSSVQSKERSYSKKKFLSNSSDYHDFIKYSQARGQKEKFTSRFDKSIFELNGEDKVDFPRVQSNLPTFQPSVLKTFNNFKSDSAKRHKKSHASHNLSVKSYRNRKKENILLMNSDLSSFQRQGSENFDTQCISADDSSIVSSDNDAPNQNFKDINCEKYDTTTTPKYQIKDFCSFIQDGSKDFERFKRPNATLSEITNIDPEKDKRNPNKSLDSQKKRHLKSNKRISEAQENSFKNTRNGVKCKNDIYSDFSENSLKFKNGSHDISEREMKNNFYLPHKAPSSASSVHDALRFTSSKNFLEAFDFRLSDKTSSSKKEPYSSRPKKRKIRKKYTLPRSITDGELSCSSLNLNSDQACGNYVQVIYLPGDCCEQHKLIASFELLKVKPLKEVVLSTDQC